MRHCVLLFETLLSRLDVVELNLRLHLIMFVPNFIMFTFVSFHKNDPDLLCVLFLCCSTLSVTIIVIISLDRERGSAEPQTIEYYESTA